VRLVDRCLSVLSGIENAVAVTTNFISWEFEAPADYESVFRSD